MMDPEFTSLLDRQKEVYARVQELIDRQEKALEDGDISALLQVLSEKQELFDAMQANEQAMKTAVERIGRDGEVKAALDEMAQKVQALLEREEKSLGALKELKEDAVRSAGKLQQSRRVLDAYKKGLDADARFIDEDT